MCLGIYLPVQQGLFDKHVHGVEQQIGLGSVRPQGVNHDALDQARLPQRLHEVDELLGQPERHELRHGEELRAERSFIGTDERLKSRLLKLFELLSI